MMQALNLLYNSFYTFNNKGRLTQHWPFFLGLGISLCVFCFSVLGFNLHYYPGDLIDGRFNQYILEHNFLWLTGNIDAYWNAPFMFPEKQVFAFSDNLLGTMPFYALYRVFNVSPETSFQLWFITIHILNFICAYLCLYAIIKSSWAAICGAIVFCGSIALQSQMGHAQVFSRFPLALMLWALWSYHHTKSLKALLMALVFWVWQWYCGIYLGFLALVLFGVTLLISFIHGGFNTFKNNTLGYKLRFMALPFIGLLLLLPLLIPYLNRAQQVSMHSYNFIFSHIPTVASFFYSWKGSLLWDGISTWQNDLPDFWDHMLFPGSIAWLGILIWICYTLANPHSTNRFLVYVFIVLFFCFVRIGNVSLYTCIYHIPGFGSMKAIQRIINVHLIFFALGIAFSVNLLIQRIPKFKHLIGILALTVIVCDNYVYPDFIHRRKKSESQKRVNYLKNKLKQVKPGTVFSYEPHELKSSGADYQLDAMLAAQQTGNICINGYSATSPGAFSPYWANPNENNRMAWLRHNHIHLTQLLIIH